MKRVFLYIFAGIIFFVIIAFFLQIIYFPTDITGLFPIYHSVNSRIPHNSLISDPFTQFEPWRYLAKKQILSWEFPLWNNLNAKGVPLFANGQSAVLFPLNIIYYIFPISISLNLIPLLKLFSLFSFSYLYLKSIGSKTEYAFLGSAVIIFSGFAQMWLLWPHSNVFIFLPLLLYLTELISKNPKNHRPLVLLSVTYSLMIFGGHLETLFNIMVLHACYIFFKVGVDFKKIFKFAIFILAGFFLSSIQLIPQLEYLVNSFSLSHRVLSPFLYLPLVSFALSFFPFISGAPHLAFYKPISSFTNFQEPVSAYTGLIVLVTAIFGSYTLFKDKIVRFWSWAIIISTFLAFKIWPVSYLEELPILSQNQNSRFSLFIAFGLSIIFTITIQNIEQKIQLKKRFQKLFLPFFASSIFIIPLIYIIPRIIRLGIFAHPFFPFLQLHIVFILITTLLFFFIEAFVKQTNRSMYWLVMGIFLIGLQTFFLLSNYVPLTKLGSYYPKTQLISELASLKGTVLEVGNPSLPPDINIIYGISNADNYDAIDVKNYKEAFDKSFPIKNHWGKVDIADVLQLKKFGISYVLSDYNPNLFIQPVQSSYTKLIGPITNNKYLESSFIAENGILSEIRLLTANYNKKNTCEIIVSIYEKDTKIKVWENKFSCENILDKMFYTVETGRVNVIPGKEYIFKIASQKSNVGNAIGFWGNNDDKIYFSLLYEHSGKNDYELISQENGVKLWKIPGVSDINIPGEYRILHSTSSNLIIEYIAGKGGMAEIKSTNYPGWEASIDGNPIKILYSQPFIQIRIPAGEHVIDLSYKPLSIITGLVVSFISIVTLFIYFIRKEVLRGRGSTLFNKIIQEIRGRSVKTNLLYFLITGFLSLLGGIVVFLGINNFILPYSMPIPFTTAINWLTVNKHSMLLDYIRFSTFCVSIFSSLIIGWLILLWKKNR